jgi:hypothetical protein
MKTAMGKSEQNCMRRLITIRVLWAIAFALVVLTGRASAQSSAPRATPTVDQIIDRYLTALGGRAAIEKQTSRASLGTIEVPAMHLSGTVMIHEKAPDKVLQVVIFSANVFRQGYDGAVGWTDDPADGTRVLSGAELNEVRRDADFFHALHLHEIYPKLAFSGIEKIGDRDTYVLEGTAAGETDSDKMYFDTETGLTVRVVGHRQMAMR